MGSGREVAGSDATMSLIKSCKDGNLKGVKAALQSGNDVNSKDEYGCTGLMYALGSNNNSVVAFLLNTPNIDVNLKNEVGLCALNCALLGRNDEGLKMLLNVPNIDVNTVGNNGWSAVHWAVNSNSFAATGLKLLLSHPNLTALTLNQKDKRFGATPVMWAVTRNTLKDLEVLVADPRVDLDTTNKEGKSLKKVARDGLGALDGREKIVAEAR